MDYLHAGYRAPARWRTSGDETITIRWYRAAPDAQVYTEPHAFGSSVYDDPDFPPYSGPGELRQGHTWSSSGVPIYDGTGPVSSEHYLLHGVPLEVGEDIECVDGSVGFDAQMYAPATGCLTTELSEHIILEDGSGCILWF